MPHPPVPRRAARWTRGPTHRPTHRPAHGPAHRRAALLAVLVLLIAGLLAGCGDDGGSSATPTEGGSGATEGSSAMCDALGALDDDVSRMKQSSSAAEFQSAFNAARQDFADLEPAARESYGNDVDAVQQSLNDFGDALKSFGTQGALDSLQQLGNAAGDLETAVQTLAGDLPCPSGNA